MTKITIENEHGVYSVSREVKDDYLPCVLEKVIKPCLLAAGYSEGTIDRYIVIDEDVIESCYED